MQQAEEKFYRALKDVFVGAQVEGELGYINLMRIKSRYFEEGVFPELRRTIGADAVHVDLGRPYDGVDVAETLFYVTGKAIRRLTAASVTFEDGTEVDLHNPPWELVKPLIWW